MKFIELMLLTFVISLPVSFPSYGQSFEKDMGRAAARNDEKNLLKIAIEYAEKGNSEAQLELSRMYRVGDHSLPIDSKKWFYWINRAIKSGNAKAMWILGNDYENGDGVPVSHTKAMELYHQSASRGYPTAMNTLGDHYSLGVLVRKNTSLAKYWYTKAISSSDEFEKKHAEFGLDWLKVDELLEKQNNSSENRRGSSRSISVCQNVGAMSYCFNP